MKIQTATEDFGATEVMIPVIRKLREKGNQVEAFAFQNARAFGAYRDADLSPKTGTSEELRVLVGEADAVICGVTSSDAGADRLALSAAIESGKPVFVVLETWPHRWLRVYEGRDVSLYQRVTMIFVPDQASVELMVKNGFARERVVALGNPIWDGLIAERANKEVYRAEQRKKFNIPSDALVFLFTTTLDLDDPTINSPNHPEWLGKSEESVAQEFLEAVRDVHKANSRVYGIIRQKPGNGRNKIRQLIANVCPDVVFDDERYKGGAPTILASDAVFGMATLAVQNAALLEVPAFFYLPRLCREDPMEAPNEAGVTIPLYEEGAMGRMIAEIAANPQDRLAFYRQRMNLSPAGNAVEAIAERILATLGKRA